MLASTSAIKKQFTIIIIENKAVQFRDNILESSIVDAQKALSWYSMGSPKAKVRLENGSKVIALLDISAEINIMIEK